MNPRLRARLRYVTEPADGEPAGGAGAAPAADESKTTTPEDKPLGPNGEKALSAERDARATAERELAALRKEVEDAKKTAEQRAADDLTAARTTAAEAAAKALRYEVAAEKGLPLTAATRLAGSTREELLADADALKALLGTTAAGTPKPDRSQGGGNTDGSTSIAAGRDLYAERHPKK